MVVDRHADRLRLAESIGAIAIDDSKVDPVQAVLDETMGLGADNGCECVGYQAHEPDGQEQANLTMNRLVASGRCGTRRACTTCTGRGARSSRSTRASGSWWRRRGSK